MQQTLKPVVVDTTAKESSACTKQPTPGDLPIQHSFSAEHERIQERECSWNCYPFTAQPIQSTQQCTQVGCTTLTRGHIEEHVVQSWHVQTHESRWFRGCLIFPISDLKHELNSVDGSSSDASSKLNKSNTFYDFRNSPILPLLEC